MNQEDFDLIERLARGIIHLANRAVLTREEWFDDPDIHRALVILGWTVDQAKTS